MVETARVAETPKTPTATPTAHGNYRPALDGMRAVAVYLVVAFHAGLAGFAGGFIGVDVFFVLSGYLVTQILVRDVAASGRVTFSRFYARRVRRILPAAATTLVVTALAYRIVATQSEVQDALGGFRAAFLYVANWYFIHQSTNYFAGPITASPVQQFWSLAVEEQFYVVWPLLLSLLFFGARRAGRHRDTVIRAVVSIACVLSAAQAVRLGASNLDRAYYGTDTRAYQLLLGALLALSPQLFTQRSRLRRFAGPASAVALAAVVFIGTSATHVSAITRGLWVAAFATVLILSLENAPRGGAARALSRRRVTYLGRISYGTYLWHWPVIIVATKTFEPNHVVLFVVTCVIATSLAALSFHVIEHPIRTSVRLDAYRRPVIAVGLAVSVIAGVLLMPAILRTGQGSSVVASTRGPGGSLQLLDWRVAKKQLPPQPDCLGASIEKCIVVHGNGARVLLVGDSNARMWIPTLDAIARAKSLSFAAAILPNCPWQLNLEYAGIPDDVVANCKRHQADWYNRVIPQFDPDVVVMANRAYADPLDPTPMTGPGGQHLAGQSPELFAAIRSTSAQTVARLRGQGRNVVLLEPIPLPKHGYDPLSCLSSAGSETQKCTFVAAARPTPVELTYRSLAKQPGVWSLDLDPMLCPQFPTCVPIVDNVIVRRDHGHVTVVFAELVAPRVQAILDRDGAWKRVPASP